MYDSNSGSGGRDDDEQRKDDFAGKVGLVTVFVFGVCSCALMIGTTLYLLGKMF